MLLIGLAAFSLSAQASAARRTTLFAGEARQTAIMTGVPGKRLLSVTALGDPSMGAGIQADCELRAREAGKRGAWHLIPFSSDAMAIEGIDLRNVHFTLRSMTGRTFRIETDFGEKYCGAGLSFTGIYRSK
jgi:hypothetical protein